jgi:hypothetical protein
MDKPGDGNPPDKGFSVWAQQGPLPEEKQVDHLATVLTATNQFLHDEVKGMTGHEDIKVAISIIIKHERFPADPEPFLAVASLPDNIAIAYALLTQAFQRVQELVMEESSGEE